MTDSKRSAPAGLRPLFAKARARRIERLKREIGVLEGMGEALFLKAVGWALLWVPIMAAVLIGLSAKLHWWGASPAVSIAACIAFAALLFWIGRTALWVPVIVIFVALAILVEGGIDLPDLSSGKDSKPEKPSREAKVQRALSKRRALLARLEGA